MVKGKVVSFLESMVNKQIELDLVFVCWNGKGIISFCQFDATYDGNAVQSPVNA